MFGNFMLSKFSVSCHRPARRRLHMFMLYDLISLLHCLYPRSPTPSTCAQSPVRETAFPFHEVVPKTEPFLGYRCLATQSPQPTLREPNVLSQLPFLLATSGRTGVPVGRENVNHGTHPPKPSRVIAGALRGWKADYHSEWKSNQRRKPPRKHPHEDFHSHEV